MVDLKTGTVTSNFFANATSSGSADGGNIHLAEDSLYSPRKEKVEKFIRTEIDITSMPTDQWAEAVVKDVSKKGLLCMFGREGMCLAFGWRRSCPWGSWTGW